MDSEGNVRRRAHVQPVTARKPGNLKMHPRDGCGLPVPPEITPALVAEVEAMWAAGDIEGVRRLALWGKSHWLTVLLRIRSRGQSCEDCPFGRGFPHFCNQCPRQDIADG